MARCRDYLSGDLTPYFETGVDTVEDAALRLARAAIAMARSIPLGAQATVAVETLEVLRRHGLKGVYGLILRKEFMAAAELLCRVTGIDRRSWPLSVHELSAAVFYALARHRLLRGMDPEREHRIHAVKEEREEEGGKRDDTEEGPVSESPASVVEGGGGTVVPATGDADSYGAGEGGGLEILPAANAGGKPGEEEEEEEEGGDTILWGAEPTVSNPVLYYLS